MHRSNRAYPDNPYMSGGGQQPQNTGDGSAEAMLEAQNDESLRELQGRVSAIHQVSLLIRDSVHDSLQDVDALDSDMGSAGLSLAGARRQLQRLFTTGDTKHMMYLVLFVFGVFLILYIVLKLTRG